MKKIKKVFCIFLCASTVVPFASCAKTADIDVIKSLFSDTSKISYSNTYVELKSDKKNKTDSWRQGMVSGNGMQGVVTSGAPYNDTFIFQNMHFIMPNKNTRSCPDTADELETVKQSIVKGEDITDNANYDDVYYYHPGGELRMEMTKSKASDYVRYTDYETSQLGVYYSDKGGVWQRNTFTSMADGAVITKVDKSSTGSKINMTLSFDNISALANYGDGNEVDMKYKKLVSDSADCLSFVAHYPSYDKSELKKGGYATVTYVITVGGNKEKTSLSAENNDAQYVGSDNSGIKITDADAVYLVTVSGRSDDMGDIAGFEKQNKYDLVNSLYGSAKSVAEKYTKDSEFDYNAALDAHLKIYKPQFDAVTFKLDGGDSTESNEALIKSQKGDDTLNPALMQRRYYSGRFAYLCCSGYSTSRLYGMWTGEWNTGWGSKYTMDANVNLQTSSMNTSNMSSTPVGYAVFILRQLPDWMENAKATHDFTDAIQAPVNTDGDCAVINETCYPYPFRYWNAGASWMIEPLYETLKCYGNIKIPLNDEYDLGELKSVLSNTSKPLSDGDVAKLKQRGYLMLREDILLPLLTKSANYWTQLMTPDYYTDSKGGIHYEKGKTSLNDDEYYCILPSYSPENNPSNYPSPSTANCAIDISACKNNIQMLLDVTKEIDANTDTSKWDAFIEKIPPYLYDDTGALKEWATTAFEENNEHRHLSHMYCAWPLYETQGDEKLTAACEQAIANRESENEASHALVHRSLIAARLKDREGLTDALTDLMNHKIHYDSLMTNHDYDRGSCYCTDFEIGYLGIVNESLIFSNNGVIELLPALPESGFDSGEIKGVRARMQATVNSMKWSVKDKYVNADITSDIAQSITVSSPMSNDKVVVEFKAGETKSVSLKLK